MLQDSFKRLTLKEAAKINDEVIEALHSLINATEYANDRSIDLGYDQSQRNQVVYTKTATGSTILTSGRN